MKNVILGMQDHVKTTKMNSCGEATIQMSL